MVRALFWKGVLSLKDDRVEFEANKQRQSVALGQDKAVFRRSLDMMTALDRYDYSYLWSWLGVPIIQFPADIMATQEVIWKTKPDVIIETGVARGGSVIFMASLLEIIGRGKVVGVDIDIRAHNLESIETHPMAPRIELIEGSSVADETLREVRAQIPDGASVMVVLDSDHSRDHVLAELRAYGPLVTRGCYMVVADTAVGHLDPDKAPKKRSKVWFKGDEPLAALNLFLQESDAFEVDEVLNGKLVFSSSPGGYIVRT
jgi:cephalosporin hydroxylase